MFQSSENLYCPPSEALLLFCKVTNPLSNTFHPHFLETILKRYIRERGANVKFFRKPSRIKRLLNASWERAMTKHRQQNPGGPIPGHISIKVFSGFFTLQYTTRTSTRIQLTVWCDRRLTTPSEFRVFGPNRYSVGKYATSAGLPEPKFRIDVRHITSPDGKNLLLPNPLPKDLRNVMIPLGDVLDFFGKYQ